MSGGGLSRRIEGDMAPEVSVCIPAYRGAEMLPATLRSVLAQDHDDFEVVVVDNASEDGTDRAVRPFLTDPRVRFLPFTEHVPLADNWRRAVDACRGDFVKLVCADDIIHPRALSMQALVLRDDPTVSLVVSRRHVIDDQGRILAGASGLHGLIGRHTGADVARAVLRLGINPIGEPNGALFRRSDYDAVGGWDGNHVFAMDIELFLRLLTRGDLIGQSDSLAAFRVWPQSLSSAHSARQYEQNLAFVRRVAETYGEAPDDRRHTLAVKASWAAWRLRQVWWEHSPRPATRRIG